MLYISLKWKALIVTSLLFMSLFIGRAISMYLFFDDQHNNERKEQFLRHKQIANASLTDIYVKLQSLAGSITSIAGVNAALIKENPKQSGRELEVYLEEYWWQLQLENDITTIALYNQNNIPLTILGDFEFPTDIITLTNQTEKPQHSINCYRNCFIYSTSPLLVDGKHVGTALYGTSLSNFILNFKNITGNNIAVVYKDDIPNNKNSFIDNWKSNILAITDAQKMPKVLRFASEQITINDFFEKPHSIEFNDKFFDFSSLLLTISEADRPGFIIIISDITDKVQSYRTQFINGIIYDACGLIALGLCLLGILWQPMNRLRTIATYIPLLASNAFQLVRSSLRHNTREKGVLDESDTLSRHAIELADKLEAMQNQILERTADLELHQNELQKERDFVTGLLNTAHAVIITHDHTGTITLVNQHACLASGYTREELIGSNFSILFPTQVLPGEFVRHVDDLLSGSDPTFHHEADLRCKNGKSLFMAWYHSTIPNMTNESNQILTVALDISERKKAEDHLGWLASHDTLTSLFNRRRFNEELEQTLAFCQRYQRESALMFIDLDNFKDVNDTSGHHVGDLLLKRVSETLRQETRDTDVVGRFGGDEFAVLLKEISKEEADQIARRVCQKISNIQVAGEHNMHQGSCSIGVVLFPGNGNDHPSEILANADLAMYNSKRNGRNNWCFYDDSLLSKEEAKERVYWDQLVKTSLENNQITLFFQPIMKIKQRSISHYECLLRIKEDGKILPPVNFIRAAEEGGLITKVDEYVIDLAFQYKRLLEMNGIDTSFAINLSGLSFQNSNLVHHVSSCAEEYGINRNQIIFEITETAAVSDTNSSNLVMHQLKEKGFLFALDDFGAGFSSLYYLKQFPIDFIKIDGAFIKNITTDIEDQVLVKTVIDAANAFELHTIAEFVENKEALLLLESMRVDYAQGYFIDKPKSFDEIWDVPNQTTFTPSGPLVKDGRPPDSPNKEP